MKYTITKTRKEGYTFYGIQRVDGDSVMAINDITTDKSAIFNLCNKLKKGNVTETTFMDIIDDFVNSL